MERELTGRYLIGEFAGRLVRPYLPPPLPPQPPLQVETRIQTLIDECNLALGKLNAVSVLLPDESLFVYSYQRKEALLSSQIEGINSTLPDIFRQELDAADVDEPNPATDVSNYIRAATHSFERLTSGETIDERLIKGAHAILLATGRGSDMNAGEYRNEQSAIQRVPSGEIVYVPPPPEYVRPCMDDLFALIQDPEQVRSPLLRAALAHVQFETIHPFEDGNGRIGRLIINLMLTASGVLTGPSLYPSLYLKENREQYYQLLSHVRRTGDWEAWVVFFLEGIRVSADNAFETAQRLNSMLIRDKQKVGKLGRRANSTLRALDALAQLPFLSINRISEITNVSYPTAAQAAQLLTQLGITRETTGSRRNRRYVYDEYIRILSEGTDPL